MAIREDGDWEGWLRFFLRAVAETATEATGTARAVLALAERQRVVISESGLGINGMRLLDTLYTRPLVHVNMVSSELGVHYITANKLVEKFQNLGLLVEITGRKRDRVFAFDEYLDLFREEPLIERDQFGLPREMSSGRAEPLIQIPESEAG